ERVVRLEPHVHEAEPAFFGRLERDQPHVLADLRTRGERLGERLARVVAHRRPRHVARLHELLRLGGAVDRHALLGALLVHGWSPYAMAMGLMGLPVPPVTSRGATTSRHSFTPSAASGESTRCSRNVTPRFTSRPMCSSRNWPSNGITSTAALSQPMAEMSRSARYSIVDAPRPGWRNGGPAPCHHAH